MDTSGQQDLIEVEQLWTTPLRRSSITSSRPTTFPRRTTSLPGLVNFSPNFPIQRTKSFQLLKSPLFKRKSPKEMGENILQRIQDLRIKDEIMDPLMEPYLTPTQESIYFPTMEQSCPISQLPSELIVRIFSFLDIPDLVSCAMVSKWFCRLAMDGTLWSTLDFSQRGYYKRLTSNQLQILAYVAGGFLKFGNFRGCLGLTSSAWQVYVDHCPNISSLDLQGCFSLPSNSLMSLSHLDKLNHLNLSGLPAVSNRFLEQLGIHCKSLKSINLSCCKNVNGHGVKALSSRCINLEEMILRHVQGLDLDTLNVVGRLKKLIKIDLRSCPGMTPKSVCAFLQTLAQTQTEGRGMLGYPCPTTNLTSIKLSGNPQLIDTVLYALGTYTPQLKHLEVAGCRLMSNDGLASLLNGKFLPGVVPDSDLPFHRGNGCEKLKLLDLEDLGLITDQGLITLSNSSCATTLERLALGGMDDITDQSVIQILKQCKSLSSLELDNCTRLTDSLIEEVVRLRCRARQAQSMLKAMEMEKFRMDSGFSEIEIISGQSVPLLSQLSSSPQEMSEVELLVPTMNLSRMDLFDCRGITKEGCHVLERRGGLEVGSFYTSGVNTDRERINRRPTVTRMSSCTIL